MKERFYWLEKSRIIEEIKESLTPVDSNEGWGKGGGRPGRTERSG